MDLRRTFYSNIVLSGGSTLFKGKRYSFAPDGLRQKERETFYYNLCFLNRSIIIVKDT